MITGGRSSTSFDIDDTMSSPGAARLRRAKLQNQKKNQFTPYLQRVVDQRKMSMPNHQELRGMISDIERNKEVIEGQGQEMVKLHKKMNQFLSGGQMIDQVQEVKEVTQQNQESMTNQQKITSGLPPVNLMNSSIKKQINIPVSGAVSYSQQSMQILSHQYSISPTPAPEAGQKFLIGHGSGIRQDDENKIQEASSKKNMKSQGQYLLVQSHGAKNKSTSKKTGAAKKLNSSTNRAGRSPPPQSIRKNEKLNLKTEEKLKGRLTPSLLSPQGRRSSQQQENILLPNLKKRQSSKGFDRKGSYSSSSEAFSPTGGGGFTGLKKSSSQSNFKKSTGRKNY